MLCYTQDDANAEGMLSLLMVKNLLSSEYRKKGLKIHATLFLRFKKIKDFFLTHVIAQRSFKHSIQQDFV